MLHGSEWILEYVGIHRQPTGFVQAACRERVPQPKSLGSLGMLLVVHILCLRPFGTLVEDSRAVQAYRKIMLQRYDGSIYKITEPLL